jgi:hypothetical protein
MPMSRIDIIELRDVLKEYMKIDFKVDTFSYTYIVTLSIKFFGESLITKSISLSR